MDPWTGRGFVLPGTRRRAQSRRKRGSIDDDKRKSIDDDKQGSIDDDARVRTEPDANALIPSRYLP